MWVIVNGAATELAAGICVADLVDELAAGRRRVAVARNGEVVPRSEWYETQLTEGDHIEVLAAVAGG